MTLEPGARTNRTRLGRIGIWSIELRFGDRDESAAAAAELEDLGYSALWIPGGRGGDVTGDVDHLLDATDRATIGTGILNIWMHDPKGIAEWWHGCTEDRRRRVMLGLGAWGGVERIAAQVNEHFQAGADHVCIQAITGGELDMAAARTVWRELAAALL